MLSSNVMLTPVSTGGETVVEAPFVLCQGHTQHEETKGANRYWHFLPAHFSPLQDWKGRSDLISDLISPADSRAENTGSRIQPPPWGYYLSEKNTAWGNVDAQVNVCASKAETQVPHKIFRSLETSWGGGELFVSTETVRWVIWMKHSEQEIHRFL